LLRHSHKPPCQEKVAPRLLLLQQLHRRQVHRVSVAPQLSVLAPVRLYTRTLDRGAADGEINFRSPRTSDYCFRTSRSSNAASGETVMRLFGFICAGLFMVNLSAGATESERLSVQDQSDLGFRFQYAQRQLPPCHNWPYYRDCLRRCPGHPSGYQACARRCQINLQNDVGPCRP
jgi:hypothetical protein